MGKMSAAERKQFLSRALGDQRHLLKTSIAGMATGDLTQALHIATSIRVLVHETGASKPLLKQFHSNYLDLPILDKILEPPKDVHAGLAAITFYCPVSAKISIRDGNATVTLNTDLNEPSYVLSKLGAWWNGICMVLPAVGPFSRRELVLGLANKEGGAHVDADISAKYRAVLGSQLVRANLNGTDIGALNLSRLVAGKSGVELLDCLDRNFPCSTGAG